MKIWTMKDLRTYHSLGTQLTAFPVLVQKEHAQNNSPKTTKSWQVSHNLHGCSIQIWTISSKSNEQACTLWPVLVSSEIAQSLYDETLTSRVSFVHSSLMVSIICCQSYLYRILSTCIFCKFCRWTSGTENRAYENILINQVFWPEGHP